MTAHHHLHRKQVEPPRSKGKTASVWPCLVQSLAVFLLWLRLWCRSLRRISINARLVSVLFGERGREETVISFIASWSRLTCASRVAVNA